MSIWIKTFLVAFVVISCKAYQPEAVVEKKERITATVKNEYFSDAQTDYVYKSNITIYGHSLSGLMIVKKTGEARHRLVFTTEFGNKLLDLEFSKGEMKVNHVVDEMNKKILLNTLKEDFAVLFQPQFLVKNQYLTDTHIIHESEEDKYSLFLKQHKKDNLLTQILKTTRYKEKVSYNFQSKSPIFAERIWINHNDMKLKYDFNYIGQAKS